MNARTTNPHGVAFGSEFGGGMSFREYIATQALAGLLAGHGDGAIPPDGGHPKIASLVCRRGAILAVAYADALIAELSKPKKED